MFYTFVLFKPLYVKNFRIKLYFQCTVFVMSQRQRCNTYAPPPHTHWFKLLIHPELINSVSLDTALLRRNMDQPIIIEIITWAEILRHLRK